jgi:predicted RNA-binding Zn ribbon-like protein
LIVQVINVGAHAMPVGQMKINAIRLVGGMSVLDYLNTCDGRRPGTALQHVVDKLSNLEDVIHWFLHAGLIDADTHSHYLQLANASSWHPITAFRQLIALRETLYQLLLPVALGNAINPQMIEALNDVLTKTASRRMLVTSPIGVIWCWRRGENLEEMTDSLCGVIAVQAATLLTCEDLIRLKACATPNCDWLFLDTSKNGRRRWCQMNVCGSREKSRRAVG